MGGGCMVDWRCCWWCGFPFLLLLFLSHFLLLLLLLFLMTRETFFFFFSKLKCVIDTVRGPGHTGVGPVSWPAHIGPLSSSSQVVRSLVFSFVFFFCSFVYLFFSLLAETTIERKTCAVSLLDVHLCLQRRHDVPRTWPVSFRVVWLRAKKKQNKKKSSYSMLFVLFVFFVFFPMMLLSVVQVFVCFYFILFFSWLTDTLKKRQQKSSG